MPRVCVDACFLIGLYDMDDQHHQTASTHFGAIFGEQPVRNILVAPWPILYECLGTRQAKSSRRKQLLKEHWARLNRSMQLLLLDDRPFRELSLQEHLEENLRPLSLVDRVLRAMIVSPNRPFDYFLAYNTGDFHDACQISGIRLINERTVVGSDGI